MSLKDYPELYYAGYTQDAIKEYVEAMVTNALIHDEVCHLQMSLKWLMQPI